MADKPYAQTIQRALDDEIASLLAQAPATEAAKREHAPAPPPSPVTRAPAPAAQPPIAAPSSTAPPPIIAPAPAPGYFGGGDGAADEEREEQVFRSAAPPMPQAAAGAALPQQATTVASLDQRIARLIQVRDWIQEDGDIARLIDTVIGKQVRSSEQRQARFAVVLNVIFLVAGWLLALLATPTTLSHLIGK